MSQLYRRNLHAVKLGLDETSALLEELDSPQDSFLAIHVAGTNGKGSVCAMLASILQEAGFRTALYTSPHLIRFQERIRVNGLPISDTELARQMEIVEEALQRRRENGMRDATFFEFTTALAFAHFRDLKAQVAVIETGMGGRLDATNVITPVLSVITPIGMDHTAYLGTTLEAIAGEKAGIIKAGRPVVMSAMNPSAEAVIRKVAHQRGSDLIPAAESVQVRRLRQTFAGQRIVMETDDEAIGPLVLPLLGAHQLTNVAAAVAALVTFRDACSLPISADVIAKGLAATRWPARLQVLESDPVVLLDGAHNPAAAARLAEAWRELAPKQPVGLIASFLSDKDPVGILRELAGPLKRVWFVPLTGERATPMDAMLAAARRANLPAEATPGLREALASARAWARESGGLITIAGSLHLAGDVLKRYNIEI